MKNWIVVFLLLLIVIIAVTSCKKQSDVYEFRFHSDLDTCFIAYGNEVDHLTHYTMLNTHDYKTTVTLYKGGKIFGTIESGTVQLWHNNKMIIDSTNLNPFFIEYK